MSIKLLVGALYQSYISTEIREIFWIIPTVQSIHILAIAVVLGAAIVSDLRLAGVLATDESPRTIVRRHLPWMWAALGVLLATGMIMSVGEPNRVLLNSIFWIKMGLVLFAFLLTLAFRYPIMHPEFKIEHARWAALVNRQPGYRWSYGSAWSSAGAGSPTTFDRRVTSGARIMTWADILQYIYDSPVGTTVRQSDTLFPWIESVHVLMIATVLGTIAIVDLRLLGYRSHRRGVRRLTLDMLPITWIAFALAVMTGLLLFTSNATGYWGNTAFRVKMVLLLLAGLNMGVFHLTAYKTVGEWDDDKRPPLAARVAGGMSLALWIAVVFFGRWIGFTLNQ